MTINTSWCPGALRKRMRSRKLDSRTTWKPLEGRLPFLWPSSDLVPTSSGQHFSQRKCFLFHVKIWIPSKYCLAKLVNRICYLNHFSFSVLEEDLSFFNAFYFTFITMLTIGFGDIVPGNLKSKTDFISWIISFIIRSYNFTFQILSEVSACLLQLCLYKAFIL